MNLLPLYNQPSRLYNVDNHKPNSCSITRLKAHASTMVAASSSVGAPKAGRA